MKINEMSNLKWVEIVHFLSDFNLYFFFLFPRYGVYCTNNTGTNIRDRGRLLSTREPYTSFDDNNRNPDPTTKVQMDVRTN